MTTPIMPAQQISLLDIYTKQIEMAGQMNNLSEKLPDHENRIRSLETSRGRIVGLALAVSVISSAGGTWLGLLIAHH